MKCLVYFCLILIIGQSNDARVVRLKHASKEEQRSSGSSSEHDVLINYTPADDDGSSQEKSSKIHFDEINSASQSIEYDGETGISKYDENKTRADEKHGKTDKNKHKLADGVHKRRDKSGDGALKTKNKPVDRNDKVKVKQSDEKDKGKEKPADTIEVTEDTNIIDKEATNENHIEKYNNKVNGLSWEMWKSEIISGKIAETSNQSGFQIDEYPYLKRRFVPQYPYTYVKKNTEKTSKSQKIIPIEAPPEIVELVAMKSALIEASKLNHVNYKPTQNMLRSGDYWNGVWKEDVYPKSALRKPGQKSLGTIKARIMPGSDFYDVVAELKKISPKLLYIINVNNN